MRLLPIILSITLISISFLGCEEKFPLEKSYPVVKTLAPTDLNTTGVTLVATYQSVSDQPVVKYGFIFSSEELTDTLVINDREITSTIELRVSSDILEGQEYQYQAFVYTEDYLLIGNKVVFHGAGAMSPQILNFYPSEGRKGTVVNLVTQHASKFKSRNIVSISDYRMKILEQKGDTIRFELPGTPLTGSWPIQLIVGEDTVKSEKTFKISSPEITSLSAEEGYAGDQITLYGSGFIQEGESTNVFFDGNPAEIIELTDHSVTILIPVNNSNFLYGKEGHIQLTTGQQMVIKDFNLLSPWKYRGNTSVFSRYRDDYSTGFSFKGKGYVFDSQKLYEYDPFTDDWSAISYYPGEYEKNNILIPVEAENKVLKMGGTNAPYQMWEFDFTTKTWTRLEDMPFGFNKSSAVVLDNKVYLMAGITLWTYDITTGVFTKKSNIPGTYYYSHFGLFIYDGEIRLVTHNQNYTYNKESDVWSKGSSNNFPLSTTYTNIIQYTAYNSETGYVLINNKLYKYDGIRDTWIHCSNYTYCETPQKSHYATFTIEDEIYFVNFYESYAYCDNEVYSFKF